MTSSRRIARNGRRPGLAAGCLVFWCLPAFAPPPAGAMEWGLAAATTGYGIDFWREPEGLPQSRIRAIVQTRDGYIWLGTDNGLVRFNGASFTAFTAETGSLKDNEVWALQEDDEQALWIGTYGGGITRLKEGRFRTFTTADGLPDDVVTHIDKDSSGDLWISTQSGLSRYSHGVFTNLATSDPLDHNFGAICALSPRSVFAATESRVLRFAGGRFEPVDGIAQGRDGAIEQLVCASDGSLWIGFSNAVIKRWKNGALTTYASEHSPMPQVTLLYQDPAGGMWADFGQKLHKLKNRPVRAGGA